MPKKYSDRDLVLVGSAVRIIRNNPEMYLRGQRIVAPQFLAVELMSTLMWSGALPVHGYTRSNWWCVSSDVDWLIGSDGLTVERVFQELVPQIEAGANSMRAEVLLTAFSDVLVTWNALDTAWIKGADRRLNLPCTHNERRTSVGRTVAFMLD